MILHTKRLSVIILGGLMISLFSGCSEKDENPEDTSPTPPVLTTAMVTAILQNSATSGGTISFDGGAPVTGRGICWSILPGPQIIDSHTADGAGTGTFISQMTGLIPDTIYYVRAYATNSKGTAYGNIQSFKTLKITLDSVADIDGNIYHIIPAGQQSWLRENLRVTRYRNGEVIPNVTLETQWKNLTSGACCTYDNLASNGLTYGLLYNWHVVSDTRGVCPVGWHVPSDSEWAALGNFLGGNNIAGGMMKSTGTIEGGTGLWYAPNTGATNSIGFNGLPGGYRINYGTFYSIGNLGYFWSSSDTASLNGWKYILDANNGELKRYFDFKNNGFSVRCCKN
jgi:uncharacterized protein (TIGR02145 family)